MSAAVATFERIQVRPIAGALGAEIEGVDLSQPLDDQTFGEVRQAFLDHSVIFFRNQTLTPEAHKAFAARFGTLNVHPYVSHLEGHPEIIPIIKEPEDKANFGGGWHTDMSFLEKPPLGSILFAHETPAVGGDTLWASQYLAYETLSEGMRALLDGLFAVHSAGPQYGRESEASRNDQNRRSMQTRSTAEAESTIEHPVVRTHPDTGRCALYVNPAFTIKFRGMSRRESRPLLQFLFEHCTQDAFTCRFRWQPGSVAFWDNRCTQHYALNDYAGQRREVHRVTINGDRPV